MGDTPPHQSDIFLRFAWRVCAYTGHVARDRKDRTYSLQPSPLSSGRYINLLSFGHNAQWKPSQQRNPVPDDVHQKSLAIVISLICYPVHYPALDFPSMTVAQVFASSPAPFSICCLIDRGIQMESLIGTILLSAIRFKEISVSDKSLCLWGLILRTIVNLQNDPQ